MTDLAPEAAVRVIELRQAANDPKRIFLVRSNNSLIRIMTRLQISTYCSLRVDLDLVSMLHRLWESLSADEE